MPSLAHQEKQTTCHSNWKSGEWKELKWFGLREQLGFDPVMWTERKWNGTRSQGYMGNI